MIKAFLMLSCSGLVVYCW